MSDEDRLGLGLYRGPAAIPDNLHPGQPPQPSIGHQGPAISPPIEWAESLKHINELGQAMAAASKFDFVANTVAVQTAADGSATIGIYQVAAGDEARLHRLTGNALNPSTGLSYTPAAVYTNAAAYVKLFEAEGNSGVTTGDLGHTGLMDFGPPTSGGPLFPFNFEWSFEQAPFVRGPNWYTLRLVSGPASTTVYCRYQISKRRMRGVV